MVLTQQFKIAMSKANVNLTLTRNPCAWSLLAMFSVTLDWVHANYWPIKSIILPFAVPTTAVFIVHFRGALVQLLFLNRERIGRLANNYHHIVVQNKKKIPSSTPTQRQKNRIIFL